MPFLRSSSRPQAVECFFCLSTSVLPPQDTGNDRKGKGKASDIGEVGSRWNWFCKKCGCWNIRDERGEMKNDHPAMHNSILNSKSFSLRAKPSTSHLPSSSSYSGSSTLFCHSCLSNQMLIMNLLSNYLPDDNDPSYPSLYATLPEYTSSLHQRYPPVCQTCQPAVNEALRKADQKAQTEAWGSALRRGEQSSSPVPSRQEYSRRRGRYALVVERLKDIAMALVLLLSNYMAACTLTPRGRETIDSFSDKRPAVLPYLFVIVGVITVLLLLQSFKRRERRSVRYGLVFLLRPFSLFSMYYPMFSNKNYIYRLIQVCFALEAIILLGPMIFTLKTTQPVRIQLVRPIPSSSFLSQSRMQAVSAPPRAHSGNPSQQSTGHNDRFNPVFGKSSLSPTIRPKSMEDEMEWEPTPPSTLYNGGYTGRPSGINPSFNSDEHDEVDRDGGGNKGDWDNFATGKQRLFGEKQGGEETGLETLLEGWGLNGLDHQEGNDGRTKISWTSGWFRKHKK